MSKSRLPPELESLTDNLPANRRAEVEEAMLSSPYLQERMKAEAQAERLQHVRMLPAGGQYGGHYDAKDGSVYLDSDIFTAFANDRQSRIDRIVYVLGHETAHATFSTARDGARSDLHQSVSNALESDALFGNVDLTASVADYLQSTRRDESLATLSAWNSLASRVVNENPSNASRDEVLKRMAKVGDCVETTPNGELRPASGITLNENQFIRLGDAKIQAPNLEALGQCYFDMDPSKAKLGNDGRSDYANHYGKAAIETIAYEIRNFNPAPGQSERPDVRLNFERLGLNPQLLESNNLNLGGRNLTVFDTSDGKVRQVSLKDASNAQDRTGDDPRITQKTGPALLSDHVHPDHGLFLQARERVHALDQERGRTPDQLSDNLAGALTAQGKALGMKEIHHVAMSSDGTRAFAVDTPRIDAEWNKVAYVDVATALQQPIFASSEKVQQINETLALQKQQDDMQRGPDDPGRAGPSGPRM